WLSFTRGGTRPDRQQRRPMAGRGRADRNHARRAGEPAPLSRAAPRRAADQSVAMAGDPECKGKRMMRLPMAAASAAMLVFLLAPQGSAPDKPQANPQSSSETYRQLDLFGEVFERVRSDYVEEVS